MATSFGNCLLRFAEPRGPDASPSGGPQRSHAHCAHSRASDPNQFQPNAPLQFCRVRPRRALLMQPAAGGGGELRDPKGSQVFSLTHCPIHNLNLLCSACRPSTRGAPRLGDKAGDSANRATRSRPKARQKALPKSKPHARRGTARKPITVFEPKEQHSPKQNPVLRPVSASLRLRYRSAAFSRALRDSSIFGYRRNSRIASLGGARGCFEVIKVASTSVLCPRAGGNLIQTRNTRLNDFLLQRSRAVEHCPASNCSFCEQKEPKKLSTDANAS